MALYFKDTEITNIDNLVPQSGLEITDIWFGETNVYTVWQTYEGTLPATLNANGADMRQYQVWGNTGGVGSDSGTAYGYEVDMSVSDGTTPIYIGTDPLYENEYVDYQAGKVYKYGANIFSSVGATDGKYFLQDGRMASSIPWSVTDYIDVPSGSICKYSGDAYVSDAKSVYHAFYTANKKQISTICIYGLSTFTTPVNCAYIRLSYRTGNASSVNLQALTPTDPPAPLPALPTCDGTTIVDYAGSGAAPEKVLLKYRKERY